MRVAVPTEIRPGERRVALVPDAVARLVKDGLDVAVESGAGRHAFASDDAYRDAGATVVDGDVLSSSDVVLTVSPLTVEQARTLRPGTITVGFLPAAANPELLAVLRSRDVLAFAMEQVPRISRAQSMDALSSQALVAGYRAALLAADRLPRFFPLFMTAAGTVPSSRRTTSARPRPTRSARWARRSSTSASSRSKVPAGTRARWPRTARTSNASCSRRTSRRATPSSPLPRYPGDPRRC